MLSDKPVPDTDSVSPDRDGRSVVGVGLWSLAAFIAVVAALYGITDAPNQARLTARLGGEPQEVQSVARPLAESELEKRIAALEQELGSITGSIPRQPAIAPRKLEAPETVGSPSRPDASRTIVTSFAATLGPVASIAEARKLWLRLSANHKQVATLEPRLLVKDHGTSFQVVLIAGPFVDAEQAAQICATLGTDVSDCAPVVEDGQRLLLQ